jgi:two-component system sensor histidine kinase/response regulator
MSERVKFLLVDDIEENLVALSALLARDDLELYCASSGDAALELLLVHDFALAIIDVQMPEMDGFELAELMRGTERSRHVPIIFATASSQEQQRVFKGYESGAVDFLFKPIDPHILKQKAGVFRELAQQRLELARQVVERERLLEEVRETLRLNEMFTAALSHDLRTPLNAVVMGAALLTEGSSPEQAARVGKRIMSSATRMTEMIDKLLDLARARVMGGIAITAAPCDLRLVAERIVAEVHVAVPGAPLALEARGDTRGEWDEGRLGQVVANLVFNAVRHGQPGAPVMVRVEGLTDSVRCAVHNQGVIAPDDLPQLFEPFRETRGRVARREGLGLGLYIVHQILSAHRGHIDVTSSEAEGTTFTFTLPRQASCSPAASGGG